MLEGKAAPALQHFSVIRREQLASTQSRESHSVWEHGLAPASLCARDFCRISVRHWQEGHFRERHKLLPCVWFYFRGQFRQFDFLTWYDLWDSCERVGDGQTYALHLYLFISSKHVAVHINIVGKVTFFYQRSYCLIEAVTFLVIIKVATALSLSWPLTSFCDLVHWTANFGPQASLTKSFL